MLDLIGSKTKRPKDRKTKRLNTKIQMAKRPKGRKTQRPKWDLYDSHCVTRILISDLIRFWPWKVFTLSITVLINQAIHILGSLIYFWTWFGWVRTGWNYFVLLEFRLFVFRTFSLFEIRPQWPHVLIPKMGYKYQPLVALREGERQIEWADEQSLQGYPFYTKPFLMRAIIGAHVWDRLSTKNYEWELTAISRLRPCELWAISRSNTKSLFASWVHCGLPG